MHRQLSWLKDRLSDAGGLSGSHPRLGGVGVSPLRASGGVGTRQSRASGLQSATQGSSMRTTKGSSESNKNKQAGGLVGQMVVLRGLSCFREAFGRQLSGCFVSQDDFLACPENLSETPTCLPPPSTTLSVGRAAPRRRFWTAAAWPTSRSARTGTRGARLPSPLGGF